MLSRELSVFLVQFAIALHKNATYPEGHPLLVSSVEAVTHRLTALLEERPALVLGVAKQQLVIDGTATDPANPVLRELANRLHRQQLGALKVLQGVGASELADVLRTIVRDGDRDAQPLGARAPEELQRWPHVRLFPHAYDALELADEASRVGHARPDGHSTANRLWLGLASAALSLELDLDSSAVDPEDIARAIRTQRREVSYDRVIVDYLLQLGRELKLGQGAEVAQMRDRLGVVLASLGANTLKELLELGASLGQRTELMTTVAESMPARAVVELLKGAAGASGQTLSHSMLRMMTKLAAHADEGAVEVRKDADLALRDTVRQLVSNWTLEDPNPASYTRVLDRLARAPSGNHAPEDAAASEAIRVVQLSLETGSFGETVAAAAEAMIDEGHANELLTLLDDAAAPPLVVEAFWEHLASPRCIRRLLLDEPRDGNAVDRLLERMGMAAAEPMLEALEITDSRSTRRKLLTRLSKLGQSLGPLVVERLNSSPWFVQRNMLALLGAMTTWPRNFSPRQFATHADARVRREAMKLMLKVPALRDEGVVLAVNDEDEAILRLGLTTALERCPGGAVSRIVSRLNQRHRDAELQILAIRVLATVRTPAIRDWFLEQVLTERRWFRRRRLTPRSARMLASLKALARGWPNDPKAAEALRLAGRSPDPEIVTAGNPAAQG